MEARTYSTECLGFRYSVHIHIVDEKKSQLDSMVHYSASKGVVVVSGIRKDDVVPFINEKNVPKEVVSVLKAESGRMHTIYRGLNNKENVAVEVHFDGDELDSYTTYKIVDGHPSISSYTKFMRAPDSGVSPLLEEMRSCFAVEDHNPNDTFTLIIKSKSMKDVYEHGVDKVASALAEALSNIAPIHPLRVRIFFDSGSRNSLRVFFSVVEKTDVKPATVPKYNYTAEVSSSVLIERLNKTISQGDWKFVVSDVGKDSEEWIVMGKSLERYTPSPSGPMPSYVGYTGGAMFVLGIFTLVLGVSIGAAGVFFVTRRQRISTLAYQVFE
ncbi:hypothetical protein KIN20_020826 [Parelaphostrongylus tenuis]|uniref:DUF7959 domain-containing protein n=1 Tax=Parelaphostrongylus tenuis TaxID=148309 RepID=A0AAD5MN35_PARTN|nr:hypothetical protein KIN20_020826 [Parelaphostrongylus tenuis]